VFIGGCHPGDCHYIDGNIKARKRIQGAAEIVSRYGFEPERLKLQWIGASEGPEFQEHMTHFAETIRALGPSKVHNVAIL
jgi:coenzyme F420-reducing hydrogenase delta subunit